MIYIGIDPGATGGVAWIAEDFVKAISLREMSEADIFETLRTLRLASPTGTCAVIEHVWSTPGQGGAFAFGKSVGWLLMALTGNHIPFDQVIPRKWQKALGVVYPKGATDTEKKNITKRRTHAISDALLIAEFCRRTRMQPQQGGQ